MKETTFKLYGGTYTVRSTTDQGLKDAVKSLKNSIKKNKKEQEDGI